MLHLNQVLFIYLFVFYLLLISNFHRLRIVAYGNSMMSCISYISSATVVSRSSHVVMRSSLYGFSSNSWKRGICHAGLRTIKLDFLFSRYRVRCYSARRARGSQPPKVNPETSMEEENKAFYVVRKGDVIGIYQNLSDCQAQVSSSVSYYVLC